MSLSFLCWAPTFWTTCARRPGRGGAARAGDPRKAGCRLPSGRLPGVRTRRSGRGLPSRTARCVTVSFWWGLPPPRLRCGVASEARGRRGSCGTALGGGLVGGGRWWSVRWRGASPAEVGREARLLGLRAAGSVPFTIWVDALSASARRAWVMPAASRWRVRSGRGRELWLLLQQGVNRRDELFLRCHVDSLVSGSAAGWGGRGVFPRPPFLRYSV